jgi:hypothetical protein
MDTRTFESIKEKIALLKEKKAKAEGALETIVASWKKEYEVETPEEIQDLLTAMIAKKEELTTELDEYYTELNGLTNWGLV